METTGTNIGMTGNGDMTNKVNRKVDETTSSMHRAIDKASDAARPAVDKVAASAHQMVDKLAGAATTAAATIDQRGSQLRDAQGRLTESCRTYVQENPLASLGIAVLAGFVLSKLLSSR